MNIIPDATKNKITNLTVQVPRIYSRFNIEKTFAKYVYFAADVLSISRSTVTASSTEGT